MNHRVKYTTLMLVALCFALAPLQSNAQVATETSDSFTAKRVPPQTTVEEATPHTLSLAYTILAENCVRTNGLDSIRWNQPGTLPLQIMKDIGSADFIGPKGMSFQTHDSWVNDTVGAILSINPDFTLDQTRRCNVHLPHGAQVKQLRVRAKVTSGSHVGAVLVGKSLADGNPDTCGHDIHGSSSAQGTYTIECDMTIDNRNNGYYMYIYLGSAPDAENKFLSDIRAVQIEYWTP